MVSERKREYMRLYMQRYRAKHIKKGKAYWPRDRQRKTRLRAMNVLGGPKCVTCKCTEMSILEINHKNGDGYKIRDGNARIKFYRQIANKQIPTEDYDVRCRVCNAVHYVADVLGIKGHTVKWRPVKR